MTARTARLFPYPVFAGPGADPSWNHDAAQAFFPRLLNRVPPTTASTAWPSGTSRDTTSRATASPRSPGFHRARAKKERARSCGHRRESPAPASIPHTVRFPGCARNPQARPQNVRNDGAVNDSESTASSVISATGIGRLAPGTIGGDPFHRRFCKHR